jgi:AcrR family transcriptional regulator
MIQNLAIDQKPARRMAAPGPQTWHAMLDAAEAVLREEGHAALTSRSIADRIGAKQRLVYYYFLTMDELITAMFQRLSTRELARLEQAAQSSAPLREIWDMCIHTTDARLISEFTALAHRIEDLRQEVTHFIEESRRIQIEMLEAALRAHPAASPLPPAALAILATSLALTLTREQQLGVSSGHPEAMAAISAFLALAEPDASQGTEQ